MATVEKSIDVDLPVRTVYNQWTQFEEFPQFMEGVEEVRQLSDSRLHWKAEIGGKTEEWDAIITDQVPDRIVAWRSTSGAENSGAIRFTPVGDTKTRVTAVIGYQPEGIVEKVGDAIGAVDRHLVSSSEAPLCACGPPMNSSTGCNRSSTALAFNSTQRLRISSPLM